MPRKRSHRNGDPDPNRMENAIPRVIRDGNADELHLQIRRAEDNGLLTDTIVKSALRTACERNNADIMRFLLDRAKLHHINDGNVKTKETLLMAVKGGEIAQLLLENGAEANAVDALGRTALMHAASKDIAQVLVAAGASLETEHKQARSALMHMLMQEKKSTINARTDIAHHLIRNNADLEAVDTQGRTILMTAVWRNSVSVVATLLAKVDVNATDLRGRNVLHHLCEDRERAKRMLVAPTDVDKSMVDLIVGSKVQINVQDSFDGKTPLHRAIERNNVYVVEALLKRRQTRLDVVDFRGKTPLHIAASRHHEILQALLQQGADPTVESDGGWTPLHNAAAGRAKERARIVDTLLSHGVSPTAKLLTGKSPLHLACETGDVDVVKLLLKQASVNITARDNEGNTPLISAAKVGHGHIVKHLTPLSYASARSPDAVKASKGFLATIMDFSAERKNGNRRQNKRMYDILYEKYPVSPNAEEDTSSLGLSRSQRFRWIHCPSNNITWCQELLLKRFAEQDGADAEGFKVLERSFNYQHRGTRLHAHYMRPMCQVVPQTHPEEEEEEEEGEGEASDTDSLDTEEAATQSLPGTLSPNDKRPSSTARRNRSSTRKMHDHDSTDATLYPDEGEQSVDNASNPVIASQASMQRSTGGKMFMFAPYLHYETNDRRKKMQDAIRLARSPKPADHQSNGQTQPVPAGRGSTKYEMDSTDADKKLILAHVDPVSCSMNARRTLDQYYYRTIDTAKYRDHDQVVHRYQRKHLTPRNSTEDIRLLMVDQLWMWIVGKDLIITSFPQRWQQPRNDSHNVLETIVSDINSPGRAPVSSVYELALTIAIRCFGPFDRRNISDGEMLFLDMFESSIGDAMDRETELFRAFKDASKEASRWLKVLTSPGKADYMYEQPVRAPKLDKDQPAGTGRHQKIPGPKPTLVRTLLDIGEETRLMREIKDIRDELNMLRTIFREQEKLLPGLHKTLLDMIRQDGGSKRLERNIDRLYDDALPYIVHPLRDIERMDTQAERIYNSVRDLLDLKQNYAISMQAADTARQGRTLMVFTVVTVIFLPLSFLTAFFALDISDFPHGPNGNQNLPLGFVAKYIFGIGFVVALLSVLLALAWERLGLYIRRARRKFWHFLHAKRHEQWSNGHELSDTGLSRAQTWQSARSDATGRSSIDQPQTTHQRVAFTDVERGVR